MFDVANPTQGADFDHPIVLLVEEYLNTFNKSVFSIANTIFPNGLYRRYGAPYFIEEFHQRILPKVRRTDRWSGYYFERMTAYSHAEGKTLDQLSSIIERIRDPHNKTLNKFEVSLFDPWKDIDNSPYGGQCLSFLSFKLLPGKKKKLALTALYRNHFYIEKLLGNLIGLGWLMSFVAKESGVCVGPLTVLSTHAKVDQPAKTKRNQIGELLQRCSGAWT
ncbi:MAG: hypothetical protein F4114_17370 [Rhodospirillaceae bacterium]|nr:hypothetical protein [Rhodospirillaceae bacterium]MYI50840.1 hypothetical protein [Rhodospirillaceae bacterium]